MNIKKEIRELKKRYQLIEIVGVTGSVLTKENPRDLDILYRIDPEKVEDPFLFFTKLRQIKEELSNKFGKPVDLIDISTLNRVAKKYMKIEYV